MTTAAPRHLLLVAAVLAASAASGCTSSNSSANDGGAAPSGQPAAESVGADAPGVSGRDLQVGECMTDSGTAADPAIQVLPCAEPHEFEVFAVTELPAGSYPGIGEADAQTQDFCRSEFVGFAGLEYDASALVLQYFYPIESEWTDDGGRSSVCLVGETGGELSEGTLRDANR